jgi:DeoR/GlpR family transcriptional regulator of sugar metabolism
VLRIADTLVSFQQKKHLYRAEKLRLANALIDYIFAEFAGAADRLNVWMGAGTTLALAAEVLRARIADAPRPLHVCTHNVEVITTLLHPDAAREVELSVARGTIDPVTCTIVPPKHAPLWPEDADVIVQGTSALYNGELFVESEREVPVKRAILADTTGIKVLLLTLHEMHSAPPKEMHRYGTVDDYDLIIIPRMKHPSLDQEEALAWIDARRGDFETRIKQWHYEILGRATPGGHRRPRSAMIPG